MNRIQIRFIRNTPDTYVICPVGIGQNAVVLANHFFRLFPRVSRRSILGCTNVDASVLLALGFTLPTVPLTPVEEVSA
ncbi:hypothetical protein [Paenibacillus hamazuiensis]|uniref:hypothetical protein n=1 Tax=Paenibacillus hamazuiensis TaxID=2936508 RepID=UPI00200D65CD|nr:hypothetical protein [Paenibacillus hamazuiensis]